ncbi:MAG: hypothetical protein GVY28_00210 [Alphaproteobacteria bacterium]|jgi:hypothetical protein|nr:hypothetical protein [Alphaproteobacteria bacterium]
MSNIPAHIAASAAQAALQQNQIAHQRDAVSNADRRHAQKLRELLEKHIHEVEDAEAVDPNRLRIDPEQRENGQGRSGHRHPQDAEPSQSPTADEAGHIDIEA